MGYEVWYNDQDDDYCIWNTVSDRIMIRNLKTPEEVAQFIIPRGKYPPKIEKDLLKIWIKAIIEAKENRYWGIAWIPKTIKELKWLFSTLGFAKEELKSAI